MSDAVTHELCDADLLADTDDVSVIELEPQRLGDDDTDTVSLTLPHELLETEPDADDAPDTLSVTDPHALTDCDALPDTDTEPVALAPLLTLAAAVAVAANVVGTPDNEGDSVCEALGLDDTVTLPLIDTDGEWDDVSDAVTHELCDADQLAD